jgi:hypothetical protein
MESITYVADIAQMVEQLICNHQVVSSIPTVSTSFRRAIKMAGYSSVNQPSTINYNNPSESCRAVAFYLAVAQRAKADSTGGRTIKDY